MTVEHIKHQAATRPRWTHFWDMSSGGSQKTAYKHIFIELPESEAVKYFKHKFGRDPEHVTCGCCGEDFSISTSETLAQATGYHRGCDHDKSGYVERPRYSDVKLLTVEQFCERDDVLVVFAGATV